jgi:hypothetical protein
MLGARLLIFRLHMMLLSLVIPDLSRCLRLEALLRMFTPRTSGRLYAGLGEERIVTLILQYLRNPWRMRGRRCLRVGLLSFYFLRLAGIPAELRFGVYTKSRPGELAHCWITVRDRCLTEPPQEAYVPILTWRDDRQRDSQSFAHRAGDGA